MSKASPLSGWPPSARPIAALMVPPWPTAITSLPACFDVDALDRALHAVIEIHETLAAGRGLVDIGKPVAADRPAGEERRAIHALPLAEMLFGEGRYVRHRRRLWKSGGPDRLRGLMRAHQVARIPDRVARQDFCDRLEHLAIAGIAGDILLAVDVAAVTADRRMAHPPPARCDDCRFVLDWTSQGLLQYCAVSYVRARIVSIALT